MKLRIAVKRFQDKKIVLSITYKRITHLQDSDFSSFISIRVLHNDFKEIKNTDFLIHCYGMDLSSCLDNDFLTISSSYPVKNILKIVDTHEIKTMDDILIKWD